MLKLYLKLRANKDINGYKEGHIIELVNDVFDRQNGIAYFNLDQAWEIITMQIKEFKGINNITPE